MPESAGNVARSVRNFGHGTSQEFIDPQTPLGAQLVPGGATFRLWAPQARLVPYHRWVEGEGPDVLVVVSFIAAP